MVLTSDISINFSRFSDSSITPEQHAFNDNLRKITSSGPRWYEVGAVRYREMRANGETSLPGRQVLEGGKDIQITSRDPSRDIPCRLWLPPSGQKPLATFLHIHGGGWVLQSHLDFDPLCKRLATDAGLAVLSVGYRLAPEHPFPAAMEDVYDVADWLVANAQHHLGAPLAFISGESAGAHLSLLAALHLLSLPQPYLNLRGLILHYGIYDCSELPALKNFTEEIVLPRDVMDKYFDVTIPRAKADGNATLKDPQISPFYADLKVFEDRLPPALWTCGTVDPLLDDTVFMGTRWAVAGAESVVKIFAGQPHGFTFMPGEKNPAVAEAWGYVSEFMRTKLDS